MIDLFSTNQLKEAWDEWLQYRKERKLPKYTPTGLKKTYTHLLNISESDEQKAIEIINQSIAQNWAGLFPLKTQVNGTSTHQRRLSRAEQHQQGYEDLYRDAARRNGHSESLRGEENPLP